MTLGPIAQGGVGVAERASASWCELRVWRFAVCDWQDAKDQLSVTRRSKRFSPDNPPGAMRHPGRRAARFVLKDGNVGSTADA